MILFPCPFCQTRLTVPPDQAGTRVLCPTCRNPVLAPDESAEPPPAPRPGRVAAGLSGTLPGLPDPSPSGRFAVPPELISPSGRFPVTGGMVDAADVAAVLSARMRPPPEPTGDLRAATGAWLGLTAAAGTLWLAGVLFSPAPFPFVLLLGGLMLGIGYLWAACLVGRQDRTQGLLTLVPPVAAVRLCSPFGGHGRRPLWFALTGVTFLGLGLAGPDVRDAARPLVSALTGETESTDDRRYTGPVGRLRADRERRQPDALIATLGELADPLAAAAVTGPVRAEMVAELKDLLTLDDRPPVRAATLAALATWAPPDARGPLLAALASPDAGERRAALGLSPKFPDREVAAAVAARFPEREERVAAKEALIQIGPPAEAAAVPLLKIDNHFAVLDVCEVLERVGGPASVEALGALGKSSDDLLIRTAAGQSAKVIAERLAKTPAP